jgi:Transcriptional regulators
MKRDPESLSLAQKAYEQIRNGILRGQYPLGAPLSRRKLAEDFGMSVVPVADALQRLEAEGLVESWPRIGTRVRVPSPNDIRGHYVVREALETQAARLFSQKASPDERNEIRRLAEELDLRYKLAAAVQLSADELFDLHRIHMRFHMRVAECCGFRALCEAIERNQILIMNWLYDTAADRRQFPEDHHRRLAEALVGDDAYAAQEAMRAHVVYGRDELLLNLERYTKGQPNGKQR